MITKGQMTVDPEENQSLSCDLSKCRRGSGCEVFRGTGAFSNLLRLPSTPNPPPYYCCLLVLFAFLAFLGDNSALSTLGSWGGERGSLSLTPGHKQARLEAQWVPLGSKSLL